jgi:mono/diheme cytochrome c family protein
MARGIPILQGRDGRPQTTEDTMAATSRLGFLVLLAACGGGEAGKSDTTAMATPPAAQPQAAAPDMAKTDTAATAATPAPPAATPAPAAQDSPKKAAAKPAAAQDTAKKAGAKPSGGGGTPQQVALGDSIFHGQVAGGTCTACHGQDAKGTAVAPDLTDQQWINGDGSYDFIVTTVTNGVPKPKQHPAPMPPKGGATLTDDQVKAVAAYVYSLSHK